MAPDSAMVTRRRFVRVGLSLAGLSLATGCGVALPWRPTSKVYRLGAMGESASDPAETRNWQAFRLGLQDRGWVVGENILIEHRWAEGDATRLPEQAADLVRLKVDLLAVRSSIFTQAAMEATSTIPIVFLGHADPVGTGHVASLARPGGNITGKAVLQTELGPKLLELIVAAVPGARRIAVLWHPGTPSHIPGLQALEEPARALVVQLQPVQARVESELAGAFASMSQQGAQAVVVLATPLFYNVRRRWADLARTHRLPSIYSSREAAEDGALMSYGPNLAELWRGASGFVDKILKGASPADLPVEQATKFDVVVNLKTAQALGLAVPQLVLQQATEIIQ